MSGGGGGSQPAGTTTVTQNTDPWSGQQSFLSTGFSRAQSDILDTPRTLYPDSMTVPFSPQTEQGLQTLENRAMQGSPVNAAASGNLQSTLQGDYLNSNPHLQGAMDAAMSGITRNYQNAVAPGIDSAFSGAGRYGSGMHANQHDMAQQNLADQLSDVGAAMAYKGYDDERMNQMRAAALAPTAAAQDYQDIGQLMQAGQIREAQANDELSESIYRHNYSQNEPRDRLAEYMALVAGGNFGGSTTTQQPYFSPSTLQTGLGTAATLAGIGGTLFGGGGIFGNGGFWGD